MPTRVISKPTGQMTTSAYMRLPELKKLIPFSSATIWRKSRAGTFIKPIKLSNRITAWPRAEVIAWLEEKGVQK